MQLSAWCQRRILQGRVGCTPQHCPRTARHRFPSTVVVEVNQTKEIQLSYTRGQGELRFSRLFILWENIRKHWQSTFPKIFLLQRLIFRQTATITIVQR